VTQIPAGWYPDPTATPTNPPHLRYWDGSSWTEHAAGPPAHAPYAAAPAPTTPDGVPLSGWWWRVLAFLIDSMVLFVPSTIVSVAVASSAEPRIQAAMDRLTSADRPDIVRFYDEYFAALHPLFVAAVPLGVLGLVYFAVMLRWKGATLGQLACGLRVRLRETPGPPPWRAVIPRVLVLNGVRLAPAVLLVVTTWRVALPCAVVVGLFSLTNELWPLWDKKRQALHDKVARTNVVKVR